jgi:hypothetical protein
LNPGFLAGRVGTEMIVLALQKRQMAEGEKGKKGEGL